MPVYSAEQVAGFAKQAGWPDDVIPLVVAVSKAESGWNSDAVGPGTKYGQAVGLMQVMPMAGRPSGPALKNPVTNMQQGYAIWLAAGRKWGPNPWAVCKDATCSNLGGGAKGIINGQPIGAALGDALGAVGGDVASVATDPLGAKGPLQAAGALLGIVTDPAWWKRVGIGAAGVLLLVGMLIYAASDKLAPMVAKVKGKVA